MQQNDPYKCQEITVLKKPRSDEARELLERVAKQVQPIMRKRCWTVGKLSEFSPRNPGLLGLNINRGMEVKIRLRPARDDNSFYGWHHVLGTMLHELVHNQISPHNAAFYKLLDELWAEAEDLMDKGISGSGQGFDAPSVGRLGSYAANPVHNPPPHKMTEAARKAAEARAKQQALMPSGPRKLGTAAGGSSSSAINYKQLTPAQAAAAAAERRARDNLWCGEEHDAGEVEQEVGQQVESLPSSTTGPSAAAAGAARQPAPPPTGAAQQQQQALPPASDNANNNTSTSISISISTQQQSSITHHAPPVPVEQQLALRQQWQQHLLQQSTQRQQRKRPPPETVDLTCVTDSEEEGEEAGAGGGDDPATCPCCAAAVQGPLDAAVMQRLSRRKGYQQWCEAHTQSLRQQEVGGVSSWVCRECTLINRGSVLACEVCTAPKNVI